MTTLNIYSINDKPEFRFNPATGKHISREDPEPTIAERSIGLGNARMPHYIIDELHSGDLPSIPPIELVALAHLHEDSETYMVLSKVDAALHPYARYTNLVFTARDRIAASASPLPERLWQLLIAHGSAGQKAMVSRNPNCPEHLRNMAALAVTAVRK